MKASQMTEEHWSGEPRRGEYVEAKSLEVCAVRVVLQKKNTSIRSIFIQDIKLDLDYSVESQVYDFYERERPDYEIVDFKWSEDLAAFHH
mgnify:FL=1